MWSCGEWFLPRHNFSAIKKDVSAATGNDVGDLIELWPGQCYHDFEITGSKDRLLMEDVSFIEQ